MRKLFVVTAGTVAAGVGKEVLRQIAEHPDSQLIVKVRYLDTARLDNRISIRDGEWQQMHIDPVLMKTLYNERAGDPRLDHMLYDNLLPKTTGVGGGQIRYNGAGALLVNRDGLLQWLSTNIADLARSGDGSANITIALILSSVGATGSGSAQYLIELLGDAAFNAKIPTPIRCDMFVLQPGTDNVRDLGLANTLALYAELAGSRLEQDDTDIKRFQGRIILVDWGTNSVLKNLDQLQSTAATLVRLINDPVSDFVAEFQEREADHHVLQELDALTHLPTHLSSVTAVTISLGSLKEQIIQRDAAKLVKNLVFEGDTSEEAKNRFISTAAAALAGRNAKERYRSLVNYLVGNLNRALKIKQPDTPEGIIGSQPAMQGPDLNQYWQDDSRLIETSVRTMQSRSIQLINEMKGKLLEQQRAAIKTSNLSLEGIYSAYERFYTVVSETLDLARQRVGQTANPVPVHQSIKTLNEDARRRMRPRDRASAVQSAIETISQYLDDYILEKANPVILEVLEEIEYEIAEQNRALEATHNRLQKQRQTEANWAVVKKDPPLSLGLNHPLAIPALEEDALESYYNRVSIFTARIRRKGALSNETVESQQLADFRISITDLQLSDLFRGDLDLIIQVAYDYVEKRISREMSEYSVLDVLLLDDEQPLLECLKKASDSAAPLVNFIKGFAQSRQEIWHVSAYYETPEQRRSLERAMEIAFGKGRYSLIASKDPTEIAVFYYVDGLPISAVQDFQGRCLDAFLQRRLDWLNQTATGASNLNQRVSVPVYSGKDAEERVIRTGVIKRLCKATGRDFSKYKTLPELQ